MTEQIELVLPLRVTNDERGSDLLRAQTGLIASINHFCDPAFVRRLSVLVPQSDVAAAQSLAEACRVKVDIIPEGELVPLDRVGAIPRRGWFLQQLLKLAYSQVCQTDFYVTLDADVFLTKPLTQAVFKDGRAPAKYEPTGGHLGWWEASPQVLDLPKTAMDFNPDKAFGVTPAFLKTSIVAGALTRLNALSGGAWVDYLCARTSAQNNCWTEYSLYWTFLINSFDPASIYYPHDVYLYTHYPHHAARTLMAKDQPYEQMFCILQSSQIEEGAFVNFVHDFIASAAA